jgi:hypothetical protein
LVLVDPSGRLLGETEPFEPAVPWWQEVGDFGPGLQVLRLLHSDKPAPPGGHVTYLAELIDEAANIRKIVRPYDGRVREPHAKRAAYAEIGGPTATIEWATGILPGTTAHQCRTWNLSAIWRLDDENGRTVAWVKQVPRFFGHEPSMLRLVDSVAPGLVPQLIAEGDHGRMLLAHAPGEDRYGAGADLCATIAAAFHPIQAHFAADPAPLKDIPDARFAKTLDAYVRIAEPHFESIPGLREFIDDLPRRFAEIAECGLPDTLVHGDLHPGNVRTDDAGRLTIMDWGDCVLGHPALDILRLTGAAADGGERGEGVPGRDRLLAEWADRWRETVPGSDPVRAVELMRPMADLRGALIYSEFLDNIEPTEWPYHADDVPAGLAAAVAAAHK